MTSGAPAGPRARRGGHLFSGVPDWIVVLAFTLVYMPGTLWLALRRPLWLDEIMTLYIARLPLTGAPDRPLCARAASGSPVLNGLVHALIGVLPDPMALRLPAVFGFLAMSIALFLFVRRRCSLATATAAMILPSVTAAYRFAFEGRPYGLLLGEVSVAAFLWQAAAEGRRRRAALMLLTLTVAAAGYTHLYGLLAMAPLAIAELVRSARTRRLDFAMWLSFSAGALALAPYLPTIRDIVAFHWRTTAGSWYFGPASIGVMVQMYMALLGPLAIPGVALVAGAALLAGMRLNLRPAAPTWSTFPVHEIALGAALAAFPAILLVAARSVNGAFVIRHALATSIGLAILAGVLLECCTSPVIRWGAAFLLLFAFIPEFSMFRGTPPLGNHKLVSNRDYEGQPIAVAEGLDFMQLSHYAEPGLRDRLFYVLAAPAAAARYTDPTNDLLIRTMVPCASLNTAPLESFAEAHPAFLLYQSSASAEFLLDYLLEKHWRVALAGKDGTHLMFRVTRESAPESPADAGEGPGAQSR